MKVLDFQPPYEIRRSQVYINALRIVRKISKAGFNALIAGGFVRDLLMPERKKSNISIDIDIATDATPQQIKTLFSHTVEVGIQFGVIIVNLGSHNYQVATFRKDDEYLDGRHPSGISFAKPEIDALRRDFTINGLFFDPLKDQIIDYVNGIEDIKNRTIRAIGNPYNRINEDKLRMLRAIRFASVLGFQIDKKTLSAIIKESPGICSVSSERVHEELKKALLRNNKPSSFLIQLDEAGLLKYIIPEIPDLRNYPENSGSNTLFDKIMEMLDENYYKNDMELIFAIMLFKTGINSVDKSVQISAMVLKRLKFTRKSISDIIDIVENQIVLSGIKDLSTAKSRRFFLKENILKHLELFRLDIFTAKKDISLYYNALNAYIKSRKLKIPLPLIGGNDLISLGFEKGPVFSEILDEIYDLQLEDRIRTREKAISYIISKYKTGKQHSLKIK